MTDISRLVAVCVAAFLMALGASCIFAVFRHSRPGDSAPFIAVMLFLGSGLLVLGVAIVATVEP